MVKAKKALKAKKGHFPMLLVFCALKQNILCVSQSTVA